MQLTARVCLSIASCGLVGACGGGSFPDQVARSWCAGVKQCDERMFWDTWYDGTPECRAEVAEDIDDRRYGRGTAACRFQSDEADACLAALSQADCGDFTDRLFLEYCVRDVWDCVTVVNP